ncbi:MAG: hypothetical protein JXR78_08745, partial [Victivallales bacterium]|nr:hypothetical protein [Victivallales bacterium]
MRKIIFQVVLLTFVYGSFGVFAQTNLLDSKGFSKFKAGDTLKTKGTGWLLVYNQEVKSKFIEDASINEKALILKLVNSQADKPITLQERMPPFEIKESGKYRASVWIKAGADVRATPKKKLSVIMRTIKVDWKKAFHDKAQMLRNNWLKYEYDFYASEKDIGKYFFRIDIFGSGTFFIANPSVKRIAESAVVINKTRNPLKEVAYFSFDKSLNESKSETSPSVSRKAKLVPGFKGMGVFVEDGGALSYPIAKFLHGESGSIALWVKASQDPTPTFVPSDRIGFDISGYNELGEKANLFSGNISTPGIVFNFSSVYGSVSSGYVRPRKIYSADEWKHYIFTWDKSSGLRIYLDGRLFKTSETSLGMVSKNILDKLPIIKAEELHLFTATGKNPEEQAFFDELRLFNRDITDDEALALYEEYIPVYPVLLDYATVVGDKKPFRFRIFPEKNFIQSEIKIIVENAQREKQFEETIKVGKCGDYNINFYPEKPGDYRFIFMSGGKHIRIIEVIAVSDKSISSCMPESVSGEPKLKMLEEIDCVKNYPASRYLDDGEVKVVDTPIGKYRTSTRTTFEMPKQQGFVYNFTINNPGKPHWLEIEYPDDKPRVFFIAIDQKLDNYGWKDNKYTQTYVLDSIGVANGINNPVTGKFAKKRLLFWPDSKQCMVACLGYKTYPGTMGPAMKSIRIYENDGELPKLAINAPDGMPQRAIGNWNEDPGMPMGCWFNRYKANEGPSFSFWHEKLKRRIEYIRFMGQNQTIFQVFTYEGDRTGLYPGILPFGTNVLMPGWMCLAAVMFEREQIPFYIQFNDLHAGVSQMVGLDKCSKDNFEAAAKGIDAIEMMTSDGTFVYSKNSSISSVNLNFLCPTVREAHLKRIRFYRDQFDRYDAFKGISYWINMGLHFKNEKTGYGDYTISLFEKESGIKIPVNDKGMSRYGKRYKYLISDRNLWNKWINWRCAKVKEFLLALTKELNAGRHKALKIILPLKTNTSETQFIQNNIADYPKRIDIDAGFKEMGIDVASLSSEPSLIIEPVSAPNYALLYKKGEKQNLDAFWYSKNFAQCLLDNKFPAMMLSRHANMEVYRVDPVIKKYWWPRGYWGNNGGWHCFSTALPDNKYLPQTLAWSLANGDLRHIDHGWWGSPENGSHERFQKFYQAYRSIPAMNFKVVSGINDPVMIRQYKGKSNWFYMVNMQYYKSRVKITFDSNVKITNTVFNQQLNVNGKVFEKELEPYQVICFRSDDVLNIIKVEQIVPQYIVEELTQAVSIMKTGAKLVLSAQAELIAKTAEDMLREKRYSALYYLIQSYSAQQLFKEAENPVVFKVTFNPDTKALAVKVTNRMSDSVGVELVLNAMPQGVVCQDRNQKVSLDAKDSNTLFFPLTGLDINKITCRDELGFKFNFQVNSGKIKELKYAFRPIVGTQAQNISIDGNLSDWQDTRWNKLGKCDKNVHIKGLGPLGSFDSEFGIKWSEKGLYLAVKVKEKDLIAASENKSAWHYDFLEIGIKLKNNMLDDEMNDDEFMFSFSNQENNPQPIGTLIPADYRPKEMVSLCQIKRQRNGEETTYEIFIPVNFLNQSKLKPGSNIGFMLKVHNREHSNDPAKDLWGYSVSTSEYPCGKS